MDRKNISLEARKALNEYKVEIAEELHLDDTSFYDLRENLSTSDDVTQQLLPTENTRKSNPSFSFHDYLGKGF